MRELRDLIVRYPSLLSCEESIQNVFNYLANSFETGGRLYVCGNGGSASDALHIVGELVKSFVCPRTVDASFSAKVGSAFASQIQGALPAFTLVENVALTSAYANDVNPDYVFAQQVYAYARTRNL